MIPTKRQNQLTAHVEASTSLVTAASSSPESMRLASNLMAIYERDRANAAADSVVAQADEAAAAREHERAAAEHELTSHTARLARAKEERIAARNEQKAVNDALIATNKAKKAAFVFNATGIPCSGSYGDHGDQIQCMNGVDNQPVRIVQQQHHWDAIVDGAMSAQKRCQSCAHANSIKRAKTQATAQLRRVQQETRLTNHAKKGKGKGKAKGQGKGKGSYGDDKGSGGGGPPPRTSVSITAFANDSSPDGSVCSTPRHSPDPLDDDNIVNGILGPAIETPLQTPRRDPRGAADENDDTEMWKTD